ncbi:MAG: YicC family protein [Gammaproteobacteria bacterium]|nr:YicC family protein [Gammaproteobacteria bacterium]
MIRSMTGYARVETQGPWGRLSWELRSVNHRYLDLQIKMPEEFRALESELRQTGAARIARGKVEAGLRLSREGAVAPPIELDAERLRNLREALDVVSHDLGGTTAPEPMRVLAWPGIVKQEAADFAPLHAIALKLFEKAVVDFNQTRGREGERMGQFLRERCDAIADLVARVRVRLPEVRTQWLERVRTRCREIGVEVDNARLEQELALAAQRLDVEEEMSRLLSHIQEVQDVLKREDAVGRRLDFLMQEFNREANTLSSKSQDAEMTRCAVEMKVIIEQMREQVQNIE